ncbi:MAG: aldolase/citrate lyase family protein, partial [Aeromicrobium sp.]
MTELRPRRSVLYMPGANERALEKAKGIDADALILDLEDAVSPDSKVEARDRVCAAVTSGEYGHRELAIRINGIGTEWHEADLVAAAAAGPDAVLVPKVNSAEEVRDHVASLVAAGAPSHTALWAMIETPIALLHAEEIAAAHERLTVIVMGTNDVVNETYGLHVPGRNPVVLTSLSISLL